MNASLVGTDQNQTIERPCKIISVMLTPAAGADATLSIFPSKDVNAANPLVFRASGDATTQVSFRDGVAFSSGLTAVPSNMDSFVIEYGAE